MDPIKNILSLGRPLSGKFKIGETEVHVVPGGSLLKFIRKDVYVEKSPKAPAKKEKTYRCTMCSYKTAWSGSFKRHFMCRHTDVKPYNCSECGYRTADIGNLKKHVTARHTSERAFQCVLCPYGTINLSHLRRHVSNQHIGERPHSCPACHYAAGQVSDLRKHILAKHSGLRPSCLNCDPDEINYGVCHCNEQSSASTQTEFPDVSRLIKTKEYDCFHCGFSSHLFKKLKSHILLKHFPKRRV